MYGRNGTGKTTFLHVLANLVETDIERFCYLSFKSIIVRTFNNDIIRLRRSKNPGVFLSINNESIGHLHPGADFTVDVLDKIRGILGEKPVYLPAFRPVLEAIGNERKAARVFGETEATIENTTERLWVRQKAFVKLPNNGRHELKGIAFKTQLCREWFGNFVPIVRFPSLGEVAEQLVSELHSAKYRVATNDRHAFSQAFVQVLRAVLTSPAESNEGDAESILARINSRLITLRSGYAGSPDVYDALAGLVNLVNTNNGSEDMRGVLATNVLKVYDDALRDRIQFQESAFNRLELFQKSVNLFLNNKSLNVMLGDSSISPNLRTQKAKIVSLMDGSYADLSVLSSGERHVLTLLFSATHMTDSDGILLIDEPELSLHVDWQRTILGELHKQAGLRQIIACTHSPEVTAEHRNVMINLDDSISFQEMDESEESSDGGDR